MRGDGRSPALAAPTYAPDPTRTKKQGSLYSDRVEDRFDVVVVALDDPAQLGQLARDLATFSGVPHARVDLALRRGEFVVYRGLCALDAERSAEALRTFSVTVEVRPSEISLEMVIEPDPQPPTPRRSSTTIRAVSPSGTHPAASGSRSLDPAGSGSQFSGRAGHQAAAWLVEALEAAEASGDAFRITTLDGAAAEPAASRSVDPSSSAEPQRDVPESEAPAVQRIGQSASGPQPGDSARSDESTAAASQAGAKRERTDTTVAARASSTTRAARQEDDGDVRAENPFSPGVDQRIEIDRESIRVSHAALSAARSTAGRSISGFTTQAPLPAESPRLVLDRDPIASMMFGLAIGGAIGLLVARLFFPGSDARQRVFDLELELERSYQSPLDVQIGELRAPAAIELDLVALEDRARMSSLLVMWAVGAPLGVFLGRMRRREP